MSNLAKFQKFEAVTINRKQIQNAPYNPRRIDDENLNRLKKNLRRIGLIETLVWNKTTQNLVSGHQRLMIMDLLEKRDDYDITVAAVKMDLQTEKEQNIFMNNVSAQGDWDLDLFKDLVLDIDTKRAGLTDEDLNMIGIELDLDKHQNIDVAKDIEMFETMKSEKKAARKADGKGYPAFMDYKKIKQDIDAKNADKGEAVNDEHEDYFVLTFSNWKPKEEFLKRFGFGERDRYVKGEMFVKSIDKHLGQ